jgi:hypothetical protein
MSKAKRRSPPPAPAGRDLIVLAADKNTAQSVEGLLGRTHSLQIRAVTFEVIVHPQHDPGCFGQSRGVLAVYQKTHAYALVVFDREGCGREQLTREQLEAHVEEELSATGWRNRSAAIVIDPELERWVWSHSPHVATALGWIGRPIDLRRWLVDQGFLAEATQAKPSRPKEAMEAVLRHVRKPRSSAIYRTIATTVSLAGCDDPSFVKFRQTLQSWFSA